MTSRSKTETNSVVSADNHKRGPRLRTIPEGDDRERLVCPDCRYIAYENPKLVVGVLAQDSQDRVLLCRRAIEPQRNFWTLPAGFMECGESLQEGAAREAWEEARAKIQIGALLGAYSVPSISQVHIFFAGKLTEETVEAGPESLEVGLFHREEIPWNDLAFSTVKACLGYFYQLETHKPIIPETELFSRSGSQY